MAVQFADQALDEWLTEQIKKAHAGAGNGPDDMTRVSTLEEVQEYLHNLWGHKIGG